ncbi:preprotein translocase subunit SecE [Buchnera aphidicola]|uniref:preprotein translocase subunit SecE n=1 Tax=Buchnera aphidicola TaxID=9 RepID=UPI0031B81AEC
MKNKKKKNINFTLIITLMLSIFIYFYTNKNIIRIILILLMILINFNHVIHFTKILNFIKKTIIETKKIIWANPKETLYTTLIITCITIISSLLLWILDHILLYLISFFINLRL